MMVDDLPRGTYLFKCRVKLSTELDFAFRGRGPSVNNLDDLSPSDGVLSGLSNTRNEDVGAASAAAANSRAFPEDLRREKFLSGFFGI